MRLLALLLGVLILIHGVRHGAGPLVLAIAYLLSVLAYAIVDLVEREHPKRRR